MLDHSGQGNTGTLNGLSQRSAAQGKFSKPSPSTAARVAAWTMVLARNLAGALSQEQAREQLAKRIMRAVDHGDTDPERLTLIAIKFFDSRVQAD